MIHSCTNARRLIYNDSYWQGFSVLTMSITSLLSTKSRLALSFCIFLPSCLYVCVGASFVPRLPPSPLSLGTRLCWSVIAPPVAMALVTIITAYVKLFARRNNFSQIHHLLLLANMLSRKFFLLCKRLHRRYSDLYCIGEFFLQCSATWIKLGEIFIQQNISLMRYTVK